MATELKRIENFESGLVECLRCSKPITIHFNGGELDEKECCGLVYRTEHVQIDLVIEEKSDAP